MHKTRRTLALLLTLLAAPTLGCIQHQGELALLLGAEADTQALSGDVKQVNIVVAGVEIFDAAGGAFLTLSRGPQSYELVGLTDSKRVLLALASSLDEGSYTQVRLSLDRAASYLVDSRGRTRTLEMDPTTVTVPVLVDVVEDASSEVTLVVDLAASLSQKGNGTWVFRPVFRQLLEQR